jgi:hypothetical protein
LADHLARSELASTPRPIPDNLVKNGLPTAPSQKPAVFGSEDMRSCLDVEAGIVNAKYSNIRGVRKKCLLGPVLCLQQNGQELAAN